MKIQILQLDQNDDYVSIRDRMNWNQAECILLIFPTTGHVLEQLLELNLVKRHAEKLGAHLALMTRNGTVRRHAHTLYIPVIDHPDQVQNISWQAVQRADRNIQKKSAAELRRMHTAIHPKTVRK